jgi:hypothetical protein
MRENHEIANYTGNLARKIVSFAITANLNIPTRIGDAIVQYAIQKFQLKCNNDAQNLKFKEEDIKFVEWFEKATQILKPKTRQTSLARQHQTH